MCVFCYRQAGWIGTGGVNRDTYHLVLAKAFFLYSAGQKNVSSLLEGISQRFLEQI